MLKVSSAAWHYRLRAQVFDSQPKDLCRYFWSTVAAAILVTALYIGMGIWFVIGPVARLIARGFRRVGNQRLADAAFYGGLALIAAVVLGLIGWAIWAMIYNTEDFFYAVLVVLAYAGGALLIIAATAFILLVIAGIAHLVKKWNRARPPKLRVISTDLETKPKEKPPGDSTWTIIWSFFMSKKRKVCPLIEVTGLDEQRPKPEVGAYR